MSWDVLLYTGRCGSVNNSPTRHSDPNITDLRTGAGTRGWKTSLHGKYSLNKRKVARPDKQR